MKGSSSDPIIFHFVTPRRQDLHFHEFTGYPNLQLSISEIFKITSRINLSTSAWVISEINCCFFFPPFFSYPKRPDLPSEEGELISNSASFFIKKTFKGKKKKGKKTSFLRNLQNTNFLDSI